LIKIQQKCFSDGFYKTQLRNCQLIATVRILPSQSGFISLLKNVYIELWFSEWKKMYGGDGFCRRL